MKIKFDLSIYAVHYENLNKSIKLQIWQENLKRRV
jgi:hypothetical protein